MTRRTWAVQMKDENIDGNVMNSGNGNGVDRDRYAGIKGQTRRR